MGPKDKELLKKLLATFKVEADEHVKAISSGLIELEAASSPERQAEIIERMFREAHSLKGAARAVNLVKIESACQSLEGFFARLKAHELTLSPEIFDQLHQTVDALAVFLDDNGEPMRGGEFRPLQPSGPPDPPNVIVSQPKPPALQSAETASSRPTDNS